MAARTSALAKRGFKDAVYGQIVRVTKALSSPKRLELLDLLAQRPWTVEELANESDISIANASQHLKVLLAAQLVHATKKGLFVEYSIGGDLVSALARAVRLVAESQLADIERISRTFANGREEFESIDRSTLLARIDDGSAILLDVRPAGEFAAGHLKGALSIPVSELASRLRELPRDQQIVAYCRGPYCLFASDAVRVLRAKGFDAIRYEESAADWKAIGLPVSQGAAEPRVTRAKRPKTSGSTQRKPAR
jgi:rhodanese-related sulfurtransferase/DNA-binding transcriptional ArsR family regulator